MVRMDASQAPWREIQLIRTVNIQRRTSDEAHRSITMMLFGDAKTVCAEICSALI